jgi:hypothetical protein
MILQEAHGIVCPWPSGWRLILSGAAVTLISFPTLRDCLPLAFYKPRRRVVSAGLSPGCKGGYNVVIRNGRSGRHGLGGLV